MARRRRVLALLLVGLGAIALVSIVRLAVVRTEDSTGLLVLLRWQSGRIEFVNSVTGKPVTIRFRVGSLFEDFRMITDPSTEEYYTNGTYAVNEAVSRESTNTLRFCSMKGMHLTLGFHELDVRQGCLEVKLLWTRSSAGSSTSSRSSGRSTTSTSSSTRTSRSSPGTTSPSST